MKITLGDGQLLGWEEGGIHGDVKPPRRLLSLSLKV